MNFTKFDLTIIVVMSIAIISMSFVFPALGLTDSSTDESDIPEFDMSSDRFDFAGEVPDNPGTPSQGQLEVETDGGDQVTLQDSSDALITLSSIDSVSTNNETDPEVDLTKFNDTAGSPYEVNATLSTVGDTATLTGFDYEVEVDWIRTDNPDQNVETAIITYEITEQPGGEGWLTRVPIVGGIVGAGEALASIVGWIGSLIWWGFSFIVQLGLNAIGLIFDVTVYFASTMSWLVNTYTAIISGANAWAAVFVAIPGLLLFGEFAKIVMVLISLLPTT